VVEEEDKNEMKQRWQELKTERDSLKEELTALENAKHADSYEVIEQLSVCFNLKEQYLSLKSSPEKKRELLMLVFSDITAYRKKQKIGRKKKKTTAGGHINFEWNEPFRTIAEINWEDMYQHLKKHPSKKFSIERPKKRVRKGITPREKRVSIAKEMEASLFP
jgi:hypothetical protein